MTKYTEEELQDIFTANLNKYIFLSGQKQVDIAKAINVPITTFNTWANGNAIPRMGKIQKLADYFGINKSDLLEDKTEQEIEEQELNELREEMRRKPGLRTLFSLTKHATNEDLEAVAAMLRHFKGEDE